MTPINFPIQSPRAHGTSGPRATLIVPTLNEAAHIERVLSHLDQKDVAEILVVDGGSTDGTQAIVQAIGRANSRVRLLHNPQRIQAAAVNLGESAAAAHSDIIIRADAHAHYPRDFVASCIEALNRTGADSVVVRLRSIGETCWQRAVALISNSFIGAGGSVHRQGGRSGWVDHGHHAAFRRERFASLGGYDPTFRANEDAEFDHRLGKAGSRIWFQSDIEIGYFPRRTLPQLARQYFRYGDGRAHTFLRHSRLRLRQFAAPALVVCLAASLLLSTVWPAALLLPMAYACLVTLCTFHLAFAHRSFCALFGFLAIPTMHLSWGCGFLKRIALKPATQTAPTVTPAPNAFARFADLDKGDAKVNMSLDEALALSQELAMRTARFGRPDIVVGIANGALLPAKVVADRLGAPLRMVRVRRQGSRFIAALGKLKRALAIPSSLANLAPLRRFFYWYQARYTKLESSTDSFSFDVQGKNVALIDDCMVSGDSVDYVRRRLLDAGAEDVRIHVICWSNPASTLAPHTHLHHRVHFYPWSQSSPFYRPYKAWLKTNGLEAW